MHRFAPELTQSSLGNSPAAVNAGPGPFTPATGFAHTGVTPNLAPNPWGCRVLGRGGSLAAGAGHVGADPVTRTGNVAVVTAMDSKGQEEGPAFAVPPRQ